MLSKTLTEPSTWVLIIVTVAATIGLKDWAERVQGDRPKEKHPVEQDEVEYRIRQLALFGAGLGVTKEQVDDVVTRVWAEGGRSAEEMLAEVRRRLIEEC